MKQNFKALFEYLKEEFKSVHDRLDNLSANFSVLQSSVDNIAKSVDDLKKEKVVSNERFNRIEKHIGLHKT